MCGRITLTRPNLESIASELDVDGRGYPVYRPRYNVAPTQPHPILVMREVRGESHPRNRADAMGDHRRRAQDADGAIFMEFSAATPC